MLRVLVVDDEKLARDDLTRLLNQSESVAEVLTAESGTDALRILNADADIHAVFLDIRMPGLDGVELARVLTNFRKPPAIAFVTAFNDYAIDAFEMDVCDYLLKPVAPARLDETVRRMATRLGSGNTQDVGALARLHCRVGNRSFYIERDDVVIAEAAGDYVRVYTRDDTHLVREPISSLTSAWAASGFIRTHRSFLVRAAAITEMRNVDGRRTVLIGEREIPVSRRYARLLQDHLGGL